MVKRYFTSSEIEHANNIDLVEFLQSRGEKLGRAGKEYRWGTGSEKVTIRGNRWFHQYKQTGGYAIAFVRYFWNLDFREAVEEILGDGIGSYVPSSVNKTLDLAKKPFVLPEANNQMCRVFSYLNKQRFIDREVLKEFQKQKLIYEEREHHNCVFVGYDENGIARRAHNRGTGGDFKVNTESSNADYSFHYTGTSKKLYVFEAPLDLLSYITLHKSDWQNHSYVTLCGVADYAAVKMLQMNPQINEINLCLDHDKAGIEATYRIAEHLHELGDYKIRRVISEQKDWNEVLKAQNGIESIPAEDIPSLHLIQELCNRLCVESITWTDEYSQLARYPQKLRQHTHAMLLDSFKKLKQAEPNCCDTIQTHTLEIARCALSFSVLRNRQISAVNSRTGDVNILLRMYNPLHDTGDYPERLDEMENMLKGIIKDYTPQFILTQGEAKEELKRVLQFGLAGLRLNSFVTTENLSEELQMTML